MISVPVQSCDFPAVATDQQFTVNLDSVVAEGLDVAKSMSERFKALTSSRCYLFTHQARSPRCPSQCLSTIHARPLLRTRVKYIPNNAYARAAYLHLNAGTRRSPSHMHVPRCDGTSLAHLRYVDRHVLLPS
jgi:hypothetical protein